MNHKSIIKIVRDSSKYSCYSWLHESYGLLPWCFCIPYWRLKDSNTYLLEKKDQNSLQNSFTQVLFDQLTHWILIKTYRICLCNKPMTEALSSDEKTKRNNIWHYYSDQIALNHLPDGVQQGRFVDYDFKYHNKSHADIFLTAEILVVSRRRSLRTKLPFCFCIINASSFPWIHFKPSLFKNWIIRY